MFQSIIPLDHLSILLNDKQAPKHSKGTSTWLEAKVEERTGMNDFIASSCSNNMFLAQRIIRVIEIFNSKLDLPANYQPRFWWRLHERTVNQYIAANILLGKVNGYSSLYVEIFVNDEKILDDIISCSLIENQKSHGTQLNCTHIASNSSKQKRKNAPTIPQRAGKSTRNSSIAHKSFTPSTECIKKMKNTEVAEGTIPNHIFESIYKIAHRQVEKSKPESSLKKKKKLYPDDTLSTIPKDFHDHRRMTRKDDPTHWDPSVEINLTASELAKLLAKNPNFSDEQAIEYVMTEYSSLFRKKSLQTHPHQKPTFTQYSQDKVSKLKLDADVYSISPQINNVDLNFDADHHQLDDLCKL